MNPSETSSTVERLGVEAVPPKPRPSLQTVPATSLRVSQTAPTGQAETAPPPPDPLPPVIIERPAGISEAIIAAFAALGYAVSARLLLFVSLVGAFVLAVMAERDHSAWVLIAYCCLTVIPVALLEIFGKRPRE